MTIVRMNRGPRHDGEGPSFRVRMLDGREFEGTAHQIVVQMGESDKHAHQNLDEYMVSCVDFAKRLMGKTLTVTGATDCERAQSFVREMLRAKLAFKVRAPTGGRSFTRVTPLEVEAVESETEEHS